MVRIILAGCHGRMGRQVSASCSKRADLCIAAGLDRKGRPSDAFPVFSDLRLCHVPADVLVDFSHPDGLDCLLSFCIRRRIPLVSAVTGYSPRQLDQISRAARTIPIFRAANLSIGANVLLKLTRQAAASLGPEFEVAITERHHRNKTDAPSGTALLLSGAVPQCSETHSLRVGTTAGEHSVLFAGRDEMLELSHRADTREVYAAGALRAAAFLSEVDRPGLYGMDDLLK